MDDKFKEIVQKAGEVFMRFGLKSVTMDDIAREIKVSKKTLYKYVKDKSELLCCVMRGHCQCDKAVMDEIFQSNLNAIDELIEVGKYVSAQLKMVHPSIHYDMEKYYPEVWQIFESHKKEYIYQGIIKNLEKGIEEGFYRKNLHINIIANFYLAKIDMVFNSQIFPVTKYNFVDVYTELIRHHLRGIASQKGLLYLKEELNNEDLNFYQ